MADLDMRVSDREREAVVEKLREHAAEGRLDADELDERLTAAYAARTHRDLVGLTSDLPDKPPAPPRAPSVGRRIMPFAARLAVIDLFCVGIWLVSGMSGSFWPAWVILVSALAVANRATHELGRGPNAARTSPRARGRERRRGRGRRS